MVGDGWIEGREGWGNRVITGVSDFGLHCGIAAEIGTYSAMLAGERKYHCGSSK